ncbi:MAG TPA: hypothetical protein VFC28_03725 [Opitutaceae bacterium]|jgi:hypothetical protein|nr:hypothetical protein [Opitutaceae bacterium]
MDPTSFRSYRDLPPVAGIATLSEAMRIGLSIDDCVGRLKRHHWAFRRLHQIFVNRLTAEPIYELKMGFSLHAHYCAEHAAAWRKRVAEMREPPLGLDVGPHPALDVFFDEVLAAPDTATLLLGLYEHAVPALRGALQHHLAETNRLVDHPSVRICRFALIEVEEMLEYGTGCISRLVTPEKRSELAPWVGLLARVLRQAGGLDGAQPAEAGPLERQFSRTPHAYDPVPRRDERFSDPYNMGVHAEVFLYDEKLPAPPKTLMLYYKRLREIDVPEMMASIITETAGQPWAYYVDMTRQLWDEARHAMMGEIGFVRAGIDWPKFVRVNFTWSLALNTQLAPRERHGVLYFIEQGLMPKTGKRFEWEVGVASGDPFSAMIQDYDWADEVLHARIGRDWYVAQFGKAKEAVDYGDKCWSKVLIDWASYRDQGLTQHENWWPALYREWCRVHQLPPDAAVLSYHTSYATARADLREVSSSG